jgi:hypothetical protein
MKNAAAGRNFPAGPACVFWLRVRYPVFGKIRQIHTIFIPVPSTGTNPVISPDWCTELQNILFEIQDIGINIRAFSLRYPLAEFTSISQ